MIIRELDCFAWRIEGVGCKSQIIERGRMSCIDRPIARRRTYMMEFRLTGDNIRQGNGVNVRIGAFKRGKNGRCNDCRSAVRPSGLTHITRPVCYWIGCLASFPKVWPLYNELPKGAEFERIGGAWDLL
jgi:hypothetical protein